MVIKILIRSMQPRPKTSGQSFMPFTSASNGLVASFLKSILKHKNEKTCALFVPIHSPLARSFLPRGTLCNRSLPWRRHTDTSQTRTRTQIVRVTIMTSLMLQMRCHLRYLFRSKHRHLKNLEIALVEHEMDLHPGRMASLTLFGSTVHL